MPCVVLPISSTPALRNGLNHGAVCSRNHNRSEALLTDSIVILEPSTACLGCGIRLTTYGKVRNQRRDEMVAQEYPRDNGYAPARGLPGKAKRKNAVCGKSVKVGGDKGER